MDREHFAKMFGVPHWFEKVYKKTKKGKNLKTPAAKKKVVDDEEDDSPYVSPDDRDDATYESDDGDADFEPKEKNQKALVKIVDVTKLRRSRRLQPGEISWN